MQVITPIQMRTSCLPQQAICQSVARAYAKMHLTLRRHRCSTVEDILDTTAWLSSSIYIAYSK